MKFLSIGCNNLCSTENDSFKTANNSSSVTVVKYGEKLDQPGGLGEGEGEGGEGFSLSADQRQFTGDWTHG